MNSKSWTDLQLVRDGGLLSDADAYILDEAHRAYALGKAPTLNTQTRRRKLLLDAALSSFILIIGLAVNAAVTVGRLRIGQLNTVTGLVSGVVISVFAVFFLVVAMKRLAFLNRLERGRLTSGEVVKVRQHKLLSRVPTGLLPTSRLVVTYSVTPPEGNTRLQSEQLVLLDIPLEAALKHLKPGRQLAVQYVDEGFHAVL